MAKKSTKPKKAEPLNVWLVGFIAVVLIIAAAFALGFIQLKSTASSPAPALPVEASVAVNQALDFINTNVLSGTTASLVGEPAESSGVYIFNITIDDQQYQSFVTKDGKFLFPSGIDTTKPREPQTN